jgi:HPt (histidine-containing phosphotransfer) domain-containing protein
MDTLNFDGARLETRQADQGRHAVEPRDPCQPVLDLGFLRRYTGGIADFEAEILGLFLGDLPARAGALDAARTAREWHMAAHTLKGSASAIGAAELADVARRAERLVDPRHPGRSLILAELELARAAVTRAITQAIEDCQSVR